MTHRRKAAHGPGTHTPGRKDPAKDFQRERDEVSDALDKARDGFRGAMARESALLAESLDPSFRSVGRTILGIEHARFDEEQEARIATIIKVIDGDARAMFALSCQMLAGEEIDDEMRAYAATLATLHAISALRAHASDLHGLADESELVKSIEMLPPPIAPMIQDELSLISRKSPFEGVRIAARAVLDQMSL